MPIYNFDKVLKTNNLAYLVLGWNEREQIEVPEEAQNRWNEIYNTYCERTAGNETLTFYSLTCEVGYLEMRFIIIHSLIYGLSEYNKNDFGRELNKWKIPFNVDGKIKPQMETLERYLRVAKQNIDLKKRKIEALKSDDIETIETSLFLKQSIIIEEQLGVKIDIRKDSVEYFLTAIERLKEKLEQQKASRNG